MQWCGSGIPPRAPTGKAEVELRAERGERVEEDAREDVREAAVLLVAGPSSLCASRLRPKAMEKTLPPSMGESETKPQFSEKCSGGKIHVMNIAYSHVLLYKELTETEPLNGEGREETE